MESVSLDDDEILISLDVVSLFTNIPIHLAIKNIMTQWNNLRDITKIPKTQFLKILQFCLNDNNYFIYGDNIYSQTYGMPMGNPLSPTIADIVLDALLEQTLQELDKNNVKIKLITKYVDDLFAIIKKDDESTILTTFNGYHNKLKFTIEREKDNFIPYLDMTIHRESGGIVTDWYTKPMASGRIINFHSTQPLKQKINTATNMLTKAITLSHNKFHKKNIDKVRNILIENSFPIHLTNNLINKITKKPSHIITEKETSGNTKYFSLPYIPKLTENTQLQEIINDKDISLAHKPNRTTATLFTQTKTKIETMEKSNVVYQITCTGKEDEECGRVYIGTTKRSLGTRIAEHDADIKRKKYLTALSQHCLENEHTPDLRDVKILDTEIREGKRYTKESLRIQKHTHTINKKEERDKSNANYTIALV